MRAELKLVRHGNATGVNLPKVILHTIGWLPGDMVVVELLEDKSLRLRQRTRDDYAPITAPRIVYDEPGVVK
jgi:antitoxin component of MazEF toxin-antitoxin module